MVVPNLVGSSAQEAAQLLDPDLVLGEVSGKCGVVDSQDPDAGEEVPRGSPVNVYLKPVLVVVPDLVGKLVSQATELLKPDLVLKVLSEVSGKCDVIDSQDPAARAEVPRGSPVNVYLKNVLVPVPGLVSRTVNEARMVLAAAGLVLGNDPAGDGERTVDGQEPAAETLVCPGSAVTVTVSVPPVVSPPVAQPPVVPPAPAEVQPPVDTRARSGLIPRWWPVPALLILLVAGILVSRAIRAAQEQKAVHTDIRAVAGAVSGIDVEVMQSPSDRSPPTRVVRIEPRADNGTQVLEVHQ